MLGKGTGMKKDVMKLSKSESDIYQELNLMRMNVKATRDRINQDLDTLIGRITILLSTEEDSQTQRFKNFTTKDWRNALNELKA
jgi:hypothetical protein